MAHYIVSWWKQRFLSGYKQFKVGSRDGKCQSREELLKSTTDGYSNWEGISNAHLQDLECDVSVEEKNEGKKVRDRKEFSFTLYDFDGHGRITKDDIAGLVKTIYEALGSSIQVPHYGSKTIKVKLTVTPTTGVKSENNQTPKWVKKGVDVTIKERRERRGRHRHRKPSPSSSAPSEDREADVSDVEEEANSRLAPLLPTHQNNIKIGASCNCCGKNKKRSSSLQRRELLKIIQANMEKNNLCFQKSRKQNTMGNQEANQDFTSPKHQTESSQSAIPKSTHHHKHRHREAEQARAMAQVVRWLEQEFAEPKTKPPSSESASRTYENCRVPTEHTHEHHHVHEHVHHHYHHYQDTSFPV